MPLAGSYIDATEADAILTDIVNSSAWFALTSSAKESALKESTMLLDSSFDWFGTISSDDQTLRWPRTDVKDRDSRLIDSDTIPNEINTAVALFAFHLIKTSGVNSISNNVNSIKVGPISIALDSSESVDYQLVPRFIISILSFLGEYTGPRDSSSAFNVKVIR